MSIMASGRLIRSVVAKLRAGIGSVQLRAGCCDLAPVPRRPWSTYSEFRSPTLGFSSFADSSWYREDEGDDQTVEAFQEQLAGQVIQAHAPDWLPLVPGSAYWIHRSSLGGGESSTDRRAELEAELRMAGEMADMSDEEKLATWTPTGWPAEHSISRAMSPEAGPEEQVAEHDDLINVPLQAATKRTFQPHVVRRKRKHGFFARKMSVGGRRVLARRFAKGRRKLSA